MEQKNKKIIVISIIIMIFSGTVISVVNLNLNKEEEAAIEILSNLDLTVYRLDITEINDAVILTGYVTIANISRSSQNQNIDIQSIEIKIFNGSDALFMGVFPPDIEIFSDASEINVTFTTELDDLVDSGNLLNSVISGSEFNLDLHGTVVYKFLIFDRVLEFNNVVLIKLEKESLFSFELDIINILDEIGDVAIADFSVYNPFTSSLILDGIMDLWVDDFFLGSIDLDNLTFLGRQDSTYSLFASLDQVPEILIPEVFSRYQSPFIVEAAMILKIGSFQEKISANFELSIPETDLITISIDNVNNFELNQTSNELYLNADLAILHYFPMNLNATSIYVDIFSSKENYIGSSTWNSSQPIEVLKGIQNILPQFEINGSGLSAFTILSLLTSPSLIFKNGILIISFFNLFIPLELPIIELDLSSLF